MKLLFKINLKFFTSVKKKYLTLVCICCMIAKVFYEEYIKIGRKPWKRYLNRRFCMIFMVNC